MPKFVLHGGATSKPVHGNTEFFREMAKDLEEPIKVLLVYFASEKYKWPGLFQDDQKKFKTTNPDKEFLFKMGNSDPGKFRQQIRSADVVYVRGGENERLISKLWEVRGFGELLVDKVYGGSSAGANAIAKKFYTRSLDKVEKGLGILPINVFCHYSDEHEENLLKLKKSGKKFSTFTIPEAGFVVLDDY